MAVNKYIYIYIICIYVYIVSLCLIYALRFLVTLESFLNSRGVGNYLLPGYLCRPGIVRKQFNTGTLTHQVIT